MIKRTGFVFALLIPFGPAGAEVTPPPTKIHQVYDVVREGSKIGTDTLDIERQGDVTNVKMVTNILVKIMFIEAYRYDHNANETWKGGQLVSFKSKTDDNGTKHTVAATPVADKINLDVDGHKEDAPKTTAPATLWSREFSKHPELFDPADGKRMAIKVGDLGDETITFHGAPRLAHHYKISGEFDRDLWFDGDVLLRMRLVGSDKSIVISELR